VFVCVCALWKSHTAASAGDHLCVFVCEKERGTEIEKDCACVFVHVYVWKKSNSTVFAVDHLFVCVRESAWGGMRMCACLCVCVGVCM